MKCPECGFENPDNATKCSSCGADMLEKTATLPPGEITEQQIKEALEAREKDTLIIIGPIDEGNEFELKEGIYLLGRDPESSIFLNDVTVSRRHAEIRIKAGKITIRDLGSLNGTFVNGQVINTETELKDGDIIQIGRFKLLLKSGRGA